MANFDASSSLEKAHQTILKKIGKKQKEITSQDLKRQTAKFRENPEVMKFQDELTTRLIEKEGFVKKIKKARDNPKIQAEIHTIINDEAYTLAKGKIILKYWKKDCITKKAYKALLGILPSEILKKAHQKQ